MPADPDLLRFINCGWPEVGDAAAAAESEEIMIIKALAGLLGLTLLIAFLAPPVIKLKSVGLTVVVLIGVAMAAYEFFENMRSNHD